MLSSCVLLTSQLRNTRNFVSCHRRNFPTCQSYCSYDGWPAEADRVPHTNPFNLNEEIDSMSCSPCKFSSYFCHHLNFWWWKIKLYCVQSTRTYVWFINCTFSLAFVWVYFVPWFNSKTFSQCENTVFSIISVLIVWGLWSKSKSASRLASNQTKWWD